MKTILITGSTDGIGLETAKQLKALGHRVILHGRNQARLDEARTQSGIEEGLTGDLSSLDQVAAMAAKAPELDVLLNNAGVYSKEHKVAKEGVEMTLLINHFAPMLLTLKLAGNLKKSAQPRVVTVASQVHQGVSLSLGDLAMKHGYSPYGAYAASKLANVFFASRLVREAGFKKALSFSLHPGVINTKLLREAFRMSASSTASGARTSLYCSTAEGLEKFNGRYFNNSQPADSLAVKDTAAQDALWEASLKAFHALALGFGY